MPAPITVREPRSTRPHKRTTQRATRPADAPTGELPSRAALVARLEAQRTELLRVMECVNRARGTIEQQVVKQSVSSKRERFLEQRVLRSLDDAKEALATAYPMLERIAEALHVDEILKPHTS